MPCVMYMCDRSNTGIKKSTNKQEQQNKNKQHNKNEKGLLTLSQIQRCQTLT